MRSPTRSRTWRTWSLSDLAQAVVTNTRDYAEASPFLRRYLHKLHAIPTPVELPSIDVQTVEAFRLKANVHPGQRLIGMAARLAAEKGVEYLVEAMPEVLKRFPDGPRPTHGAISKCDGRGKLCPHAGADDPSPW